MKVSRKNQLRSVMVLVIAALLLELTTAVQFFSMRRNVSKQLMELTLKRNNKVYLCFSIVSCGFFKFLA